MKFYPASPVTPLTISTVSYHYSFMAGMMFWNISVAFQDTAWPSASTAYFYLINVPWPYLVKHFWWSNTGTVAGNIDVGIYTASGVKLASTGGIAQAGASAPQRVAVTNPFQIQPGAYYLAITSSSAGSHFWIQNSGTNATLTANHFKFAGVLQQTGLSGTLPSNMASVASMAGTTWPIFGISKMATSF